MLTMAYYVIAFFLMRKKLCTDLLKRSIRHNLMKTNYKTVLQNNIYLIIICMCAYMYTDTHFSICLEKV